MGGTSDGPYRLRDVREKAELLARSRAWHVFISYDHEPDGAVALSLRRPTDAGRRRGRGLRRGRA